ncbi:MAG: MBL fold metallo-hydrolase [Polyangiaceae bacterium]|nr:MBL fold metallo-hydrolase [Polyangiaceae bacterium]
MDLLELARDVVEGKAALPQTGLMLGVDPGLRELLPGVAFVPSFCNVMPLAAEGALALVDTGAELVAAMNHAAVRAWTQAPLCLAVYTHGHVDHCMGMAPWDQEADAAGRARPRVLAQRGVLARFERYRATAGYNGAINRRQFSLDALEWPTSYRAPDEVFDEETRVELGDRALRLRHARGETDDHAWVVLERPRVLYPGDLFIWCSPNAGNPQKVQRYPREWALALREMIAEQPALMLPSHGLPLAGAEEIARVLSTTAEALEFLHDSALARMNAGEPLDAILHGVRLPRALAELPWMQPIYDEPEFILRNVWRQYGGWWTGDPAALHPAPERALALEVAELAGGAQALASRARALVDAGDDVSLRKAVQLVRWARLAAPDDAGIREAHGAVFAARVACATSLMAKGIYGAAARA